MVRVVCTIEQHLRGIISATIKSVSNAWAESLNARIQRIMRNACGHRNRRSFRIATLSYCDGLDLSPEPAFQHGTRQTIQVRGACAGA